MASSKVGVVLALCIGLSACDTRGVSDSSFAGDSADRELMPPPTEGSAPMPPPPVAVDRSKELLVTSREVLDGQRTDGARSDAAWSFRHLVETLAAPVDASAFVRSWLATWQASSTAVAQGSLALGARPDVRSELVCPWLRLTPENECDATCSQCTSEDLDLARAPFRLLAIVNRSDLAETTGGCHPDASEARFVFAALRPGTSTPLSFNVIFEYGTINTDAGSPETWHALGKLSGLPYASALERVTRSFTDAPDTLKQVRTSENLGTAHGTSWQLRQFERGIAALVPGLLPTALTNTARDDLDGTNQLEEHVIAHMAEVSAGDNVINSELRTAVSSMPRADFRWTGANGESPMVDVFGLSTCNGCHAGHRGDTTVLPFSHIGTNDKGETILSRFLDDPTNPEGDELSFRARSLSRRLQGQCGSADASYASRHGGVGGGGLEKQPSIARVH